MRNLAKLACILYLAISLLTEEVECRGGKGGSRGFNNKYTRQGRSGTNKSEDLAGISPTVWKIVGIGFAVVTVIGLVGFLVLYNFCDKLPDDEEHSPEKTVPLVSHQHDRLNMEQEIV